MNTIQTVEDTGRVYKVTDADGSVLWVPKDSLNREYAVVQAWVAAGGIVI